MNQSIKTILFIKNPIAGTPFRDLSTETILEFFKKHKNFDVQVEDTKYAGHGQELAREARKNQIDIVVACGGDGTINEVASELLYCDVVLFIIPLGSGNGLAHHLELEFNPKKALETIINGKTIKIDVCTVNGGELKDEKFYSNCGFGYDADVIHGYDEVEARGMMTYGYFLLKHAFNFSRTPVTITMNGKSRTIEPFVFTIANSSQYGYKIEAVPHADITDGKMDTLLVENANRLEISRLLFSMFIKDYSTINQYAEFQQTEEIDMTFPEETKLQLDGEPYMVQGKIEVRIKKHALKVLIPS